jgi:hypothetical protein
VHARELFDLFETDKKDVEVQRPPMALLLPFGPKRLGVSV